MAKIGLPKGSGKRLKVRVKSVKSQGILKWILSGNPGYSHILLISLFINTLFIFTESVTISDGYRQGYVSFCKEIYVALRRRQRTRHFSLFSGG